MHRIISFAAFAMAVLFCTIPANAQDESHAVEGGGISAAGWMGQVDAKEAEAGQAVANASFMAHGESFHVKTGPSISYWHEDNSAEGDYTVTARFTEPEYMGLNNHPHPYGLFIGGNDLGTEQASMLYCMAYGSGAFIVRGFGPEPFQMNGRRAEQHDAVNKASGEGESVSQEIALSVKGNMVECAINGTVVASYNKSDVVGEGKLKSTDGVYGIRLGHNTEAMVEGFDLAMEQ